MGRKLFFKLLAFFALSGCYDGWEPERGGTDAGLPPVPTEPPIYHIQVVNFYLESSAITDPACFGATGTELFRESEWEERTAAIDSMNKDISETYIRTDVPITASDCVKLQDIENKAIDSSYFDSLADDPKDRPIIHITAAYWNGDVSGFMTAPVTREHWASPQKLKSRGRKVISLNYFSLSNSTLGKFSVWRSTRSITNSMNVLSGTPIDVVDPTSNGQDKRRLLAIEDAKKFRAWMLQRAGSM